MYARALSICEQQLGANHAHTAKSLDCLANLYYEMGNFTATQLQLVRALKIYEQQLGAKFNIASFHDEVLKDGCVPLNILHEKMMAWSKKQ